MQNIDVLNKTIELRENEKDLAVNKKGYTIKESLEKKQSFQFKNDELTNMALVQKLKNIGLHNLEFLLSKPMNEVEKSMQEYSLAGFKQRKSKEPSPQEERPRMQLK